MASIYARGEVLWMKYKGRAGRPVCRSTGYRRGQEPQARELAAECERQEANEREVTPAERELAVPPASVVAKGLTVREYGKIWLARRAGRPIAEEETKQLALHIYPLIGEMAIAEVRPRHIRDMVNALKEKRSAAPKAKGEKLAPRTVRHLYALVRRLFKSAVIDEHIAASPVMVEKGTLPKNVDKDPAWRATAIFTREELVALISDARVAQHRRVFYALEGLAGMRHGEVAGLRWCDYDEGCRPLEKLVVCRSYERDGTKTQVTREVPVHPTLSIVLDRWKKRGWKQKYGRAPKGDDLIVPTEEFEVRQPADTLKKLKKDLVALGMRDRRGHDLRRTFITLAQVDGARREVLKPLTHPGDADIVGLYTSFPWPTVCEEVAKLRVLLPDDGEADGTGGGSDDGERAPEQTNIAAAGPTVAAVAGYTPGYRSDCSFESSANLSRCPDLNRGPTVYETVALPLSYIGGPFWEPGICRSEGRGSRPGWRGTVAPGPPGSTGGLHRGGAESAQGVVDGLEGGRLEQVVVEHVALDDAAPVELAVAAEGDHAQAFAGDRAAQELGQGDAVHVGQADIDQRGVGTELGGDGDGLVAGRGARDLVAAIAQGVAHHQGHIALIIDDQDAHGTFLVCNNPRAGFNPVRPFITDPIRRSRPEPTSSRDVALVESGPEVAQLARLRGRWRRVYRRASRANRGTRNQGGGRMNLFSKGTVLAGAVAALFACGGGDKAGETTTPAASDQPAAAGGDQGGGEAEPATSQQVKCMGINECKGKAECNGEGHSCKGQNTCHGKGWVMASVDDCSAKHGTVVQ